MATAEQRAADGFHEFRFDDGALIQVSAYSGTVVVLQQQGSTQGRGAAFLTPDQAADLVAALNEAGQVARKQLEDAPVAAPVQRPTPVSPAAQSQLTVEDIVKVINAALDARGVPAKAGA